MYKRQPLVNYQDVHLEGTRISFSREGMGLDLGAIAKGYIADQTKKFLLDKGVESALINLGGNVLCVGQKPDGSPFQIGIQKPCLLYTSPPKAAQPPAFLLD